MGSLLQMLDHMQEVRDCACDATWYGRADRLREILRVAVEELPPAALAQLGSRLWIVYQNDLEELAKRN